MNIIHIRFRGKFQTLIVIPHQAGIQADSAWTPASAGVTIRMGLAAALTARGGSGEPDPPHRERCDLGHDGLFGDPQSLFAEQFERDGTGFLYRKSRRGAPVRVTAAERDAFIETFNRRYRFLSWGFGVALAVTLFAIIAISVANEAEVEESWIYAGCGILVGGYMLVWYRLWNAPAVALERRSHVGAPKSRSEVRSEMLAKIGWGQLAAIFVLMLVSAIGNVPWDAEPMTAKSWIFLAIGSFGLLSSLVLAIQKLRLLR